MARGLLPGLDSTQASFGNPSFGQPGYNRGGGGRSNTGGGGSGYRSGGHKKSVRGDKVGDKDLKVKSESGEQQQEEEISGDPSPAAQ